MSHYDYIRTDTAEDAVSSFELAADFLVVAERDDRYWKWFVISFHAGLQGTFALALDGGNGFLVQKSGVMQKMLSAHETGTKYPLPHMDNFLKLYKKIKHKKNLRGASSIPYSPSSSHDNAIESLDKLRDDFIHFNTKSWSIEKRLIIESAAVALEVAEFLIFNSLSILWYESNQEARVSPALRRLRHELSGNKAGGQLEHLD